MYFNFEIVIFGRSGYGVISNDDCGTSFRHYCITFRWQTCQRDAGRTTRRQAGHPAYRRSLLHGYRGDGLDNRYRGGNVLDNRYGGDGLDNRYRGISALEALRPVHD